MFPALPFSAGSQPKLDLQRTVGEHILVRTPGPSSGFELLQQHPSAAVNLSSGLSGTRWQFTGRWGGPAVIARDIVVLRDDRYAYAIELASAPGHLVEARQHFERLVSSVEPIPRGAPPPTTPTAFSHWAE